MSTRELLLDDHRLIDALITELIEDGQPRDARHPSIEHDGTDGVPLEVGQEGPRIGPFPGAQADGRQQHRQCRPDAIIVIDQVNQR